MYEKPVCSALLPNTGVADLRFAGLAVLRLFGVVHRDGGPCQGTAAADVQIFAAGERPARRACCEFLLYALVILLPAVIGEWSEIVEDQPVVLGIKFCRSFRATAAPCRAITVHQPAESGVVRSALLRAGTDESRSE